MSQLGPGEGGSSPFGFFGDLMKMLVSEGALNMQIARQASLAISTGGQTEPNVEPLDRLRLEELLRVADMHVADATGLATSQTGGIVSVRAVTRAEWAYHTLDHYKSLFEGVAEALTVSAPAAEEGPDPEDPFGGLAQMLGPVFLGAQAGTLCGHLARQAMGQYELPVPRPPSDELLMVPATITEFANDWSLPADDVRLWVCLSDLTHHAVLGRPHVRARLEELLGSYVRGFRVDTTALTSQLDQLDLSNPDALGSLGEMFNHPEALLGAVTTDEQRETEAALAALVSATEGYVDHVVDVVGQRLIGSHGPLTEALRRRRVEASDADQLIRQLFGLELSQPAYDRGARFVKGVVERAGDAGLVRLWNSERELPTPAEIDAPGLWLERIDLPDQS